MSNVFSEIRKRITPAKYLASQGVHLNNGRCVSPLRAGAKNPTSFFVDGDRWSDFGSDSQAYGGDVTDLCALMQFNGDKGAAIKYLSDLVGIPPDPQYAEWQNEVKNLCARTETYHAALTDADYEYLANRGLTREDVSRLRIGRVTDGYLSGRLFLPYIENDHVVYYATRAMEGGSRPDSKYMKGSLKESFVYHHVPWGLQTLNRKSDTLIISEGYFDAVSWEREGYPVLSPITGRFSKEQWPDVISACRRFNRVFIIFDNDDVSHAGASFTAETAKMLFRHRIPFVVGHTPPGIKDVNDYYVGGGDLRELVDMAQNGLEYMDSQHSGFVFEILGFPKLFTGDNWNINYFGIKRLVKDQWETVIDMPVAPVAFLENTTEGVHKVELKFLSDGEPRTIVCDKETIASKSKIVSLSNYGIAVNSNNASALIQFFAYIEGHNQYAIPRHQSVSHVGWVDDTSFLPYTDKTKFDGEAENKSMYKAISQQGDFDAWINFTHDLRSNLYLRLMMAASFASPLIERVNALPFVFHLWGSTGKGKTVALMVAMSIWGDPSAGKLTRTMNMTNAAMMSSAAFLRNIPFAGDELQTIKTKDMKYDELIMQITEGIERGRLDRQAKNRPLRSWHSAFLFTGEERCTNDYSGGGTKNRVIEIEAEGTIVEHGNQTVSFVTQNYGHAGKTFINYIANKDLQAEYSKIFSRVINECDTTPKQAMAISLVLLGDALACECIYQNETPLAVETIKPFLKNSEEVSVATRAYEYIVGYFAANMVKFNDTPSIERWGKLSRNGLSLTVVDHVLVKALKAEGFSFDAVKKEWAANGWLAKYDNKYKKKSSINGVKTYCVEIILPPNTEVGTR